MSKFEQYNVVLKDLNNETLVYEYTLDEEYFKKIDSPEVQKGHINAHTITITTYTYTYTYNYNNNNSDQKVDQNASANQENDSTMFNLKME